MKKRMTRLVGNFKRAHRTYKYFKDMLNPKDYKEDRLYIKSKIRYSRSPKHRQNWQKFLDV